MRNIYLQILDHMAKNTPLALATVTGTRGSTPQKPGSSAIFGKDGLISGTVGGGIVEGRVLRLANDALLSGGSAHYQFNLANDISKTDEAICGGQIRILVDACLNESLPVLKQIKQSLQARVPGVLITKVTRLKEPDVRVERYWLSETFNPGFRSAIMSKIEPVAINMVKDADPLDYKEIEIETEGSSSVFFLEPVLPLPKLVIAGAGHIGKALAHIGNLLAFEVTVIDDRPEYANSENLPDASHIIVKDIGEALKELPKSTDTYVVIVTRGHKDDASALTPCVGSQLAYVGMIGSKNKIGSMRTNFLENGWATAEQWKSIFAPVGIAIGSQTVEEIAVSIAAQLVMVRNSNRKGKTS